MATREVLGRQYKRRRGVEFPDFMNGIVAAHPDREMHVVLDNLSAREPKGEMWLKRHKKIPFPLPADPALLAQPDRNLVLDPDRPVARRAIVH